MEAAKGTRRGHRDATMGFRNGPVGVKPWTCRTLPFVLSGFWPSEVEPPQHLAAGYLLPYVVSAQAAYMMRSDRGMVSLSTFWRKIHVFWAQGRRIAK